MTTPTTAATPDIASAAAVELERPETRKHARGVGVTLAIGFLVVVVLLAACADFIPGLAPYNKAWGDFHEPPSASFNGLLGTDTLGRSIMSRAIYGARISLTIAVVSSLIALTIGITLGMLAGFYRGKAERAVDLYANSIASMPPLLLALALVAAVGASVGSMTVALGFLMSGMYARATKGAVIAHAARDYVLAARAMGASDARLLTREILPNLVPILTAVVPPSMAILIVVEGSLSFLGYGIPPPAPSWGGMISDAADVMQLFPYLLLGPILAIVLTVYSLNTLGDYLAARMDVREGQL